MLIVAFDTSTFQLSIGWTDPGPDSDGAHAELSAPARPGHAETLLERLGQILDTGGKRLEDADLIVFGKGPGTFTGLRIGLSTAKGLALSNGTPIIGVSTLEALALSAPGEGVVIPLLDARRGEIYAGAFEVTRNRGVPSARTLAPERVALPSDVPSIAREAGAAAFALIGSGAIRYEAKLADLAPILPERYATPDAHWLALRGLELFNERGPDDPATVEPSYLRAPDAKLPEKPLS